MPRKCLGSVEAFEYAGSPIRRSSIERARRCARQKRERTVGPIESSSVRGELHRSISFSLHIQIISPSYMLSERAELHVVADQRDALSRARREGERQQELRLERL